MSLKKIRNKRNCLRTHFKEKGEKSLRYKKITQELYWKSAATGFMGWWWSDNDFCSNHVAAVHFPIKSSAELFCFLFLIFYRYNSDIILNLQLCMVHYKCLREKQCFSQKISDVAFVHTLKQKWCIMLFCDHKWQLEHNDKSVNSNATKEHLLLSTACCL